MAAPTAYVGRNFGGASTILPAAEPPVAPPASMPLFDFPKEPDTRSEHHRSESSSSSSSSSDSDSRKKRSERYVSKPVEDGDVESSSYWSEFDYKFVWATGFGLLLIASLYFYWLSVECEVPECEETTMTMQYAIDQHTKHAKTV